MCRPIREGGQRCSSCTSKREQKARERLDALGETGPFNEAYQQAHSNWVRAAIEFASTEKGQQAMALREMEAVTEGSMDDAALLRTIQRKGTDMRAANVEAAQVIREREAARAAKGDGMVLPGDVHWTCQDCHAEGEGDGPRECPNCAQSEVYTFLRSEPAPHTSRTPGEALTPAVQAAVDRRQAAVAVKQAAWSRLEALADEHNASGVRRRSRALLAAEKEFDEAEAAAEFAARDVEMALRVSMSGASERDIMLTARSLS